MGFGEIAGQKLRDGRVTFIQLAEAADRGGAGRNGLARGGPFPKSGNGFIVTERTKGSQCGVTQKIIWGFEEMELLPVRLLVVAAKVGGQVLDLEGEHLKPTAEMVHAIHRAKTGALIRVSLVTGAIFAGGAKEDVRRLHNFGVKAGLAFQIADDVLDMTGDAVSLGKTAGKDAASNKATWPAVRGIPSSIEDAQRLIEEAFAELSIFGERAEPLKAVARYLVERTN